MSSSSPAVTIPAVTAIHVVGKSEVELGNGDLSLLVLQHPSSSSPTVSSPGNEQPPILALTVGSAAFPLYKNTDFGTVAGDERLYVFSPQVGEKVGYVRLTLPDGVKEEGSEFSKLQEHFEKVLIDHGLLKDGIAAAGDEVGRSVHEHAGSAARKIRGGTAEYLTENPPTQDPIVFTNTTRSVAASSASVTGSLYDAAAKITNTVGNVASTAGAWVTSKAVPTTHENTHALNQLGEAYSSSTGGIASCTKTLKDTSSEAASQLVQNEWGLETREIGENVTRSAGNVSGTMGQAVSVTSGATVVGGTLRGAVATEDEEQAAMDKRMERQMSGQWQDVPV